MASERTLSIIKPDATERNLTGLIIARLEGAGLRVVAQKRVWWKKKDARKFYDVHKDQPFFKDLINFMTSMMQSVVSTSTTWPTSTKAGAPGAGAR